MQGACLSLRGGASWAEGRGLIASADRGVAEGMDCGGERCGGIAWDLGTVVLIPRDGDSEGSLRLLSSSQDNPSFQLVVEKDERGLGIECVDLLCLRCFALGLIMRRYVVGWTCELC